jgi:hypothetical protein
MSSSLEHRSAGPTTNVHNISERIAGDIRNDLHTLRMSVTLAWQERGVMLTPEEQDELQAEIKDLCNYLQNLTGCRD